MSDETDLVDLDDDPPPAVALVTHCDDCSDPLPKPISSTNGEPVSCEDCDERNPPKFWMGALSEDGKHIDRHQAEPYRKLTGLAVDAVDLVHEWGVGPGETFISLDDGTIVDAYDWAHRPDVLAHDDPARHDGKGEFDPAHPDRIWYGPRRQDGRLYRPGARSYDTIQDMARAVVDDADRHRSRSQPGASVVMLPGGELVDAHDWAHRPETRRLTRPPLRADSIEALARTVVDAVFDQDKHAPGEQDVVLPNGQVVDAYDWAQLPETRQAAGVSFARNRVRYTATATCGQCGDRITGPVERLATGEIGEQVTLRTALHCGACNRIVTADPRTVSIVDDDSAALAATPRELDGGGAPDDGHGVLAGSLGAAPDDGHGVLAGSLGAAPDDGHGVLAGSLGTEVDEGSGSPPAPLPPPFPGNITGLAGALEYARTLSAYITTLYMDCFVIPREAEITPSLEAARADLADNGLTGAPLDLVVRVQDALVAGFHPLQAAHDALEQAAGDAAGLVARLEEHTGLAQAHADVGGEGGDRAFYFSE